MESAVLNPALNSVLGPVMELVRESVLEWAVESMRESISKWAVFGPVMESAFVGPALELALESALESVLEMALELALESAALVPASNRRRCLSVSEWVAACFSTITFFAPSGVWLPDQPLPDDIS